MLAIISDEGIRTESLIADFIATRVNKLEGAYVRFDSLSMVAERPSSLGASDAKILTDNAGKTVTY